MYITHLNCAIHLQKTKPRSTCLEPKRISEWRRRSQAWLYEHQNTPCPGRGLLTLLANKPEISAQERRCRHRCGWETLWKDFSWSFQTVTQGAKQWKIMNYIQEGKAGEKHIVCLQSRWKVHLYFTGKIQKAGLSACCVLCVINQSSNHRHHFTCATFGVRKWRKKKNVRWLALQEAEQCQTERQILKASDLWLYRAQSM